jgi:nucleotide-binding universal stress UspA family protein
VASSHPAPLRDILCATALDGSDERAFLHALRIAAGADGVLRVLHVAEDPPQGPPDWEEFPRVRKTLERWGGNLGRVAVRKSVRGTDGDIAAGLVEALERHPIDLVVLATHGRTGLDRLLHGSVAESVLEQAVARPVLLLPPGGGFVDGETGRVRLARVLAPVAVPPGYGRLLEACQQLLRSLGVERAEGRLFHLEGPDRRLGSGRGPAGPIDWSLSLRDASASVEDEILAEADAYEPDLLAMTTVGPQGLLGALRGSVTERVLRRGARPVLAVSAPG